MGQEYAAQINAQLPIVQDPEVNRYVNLLGEISSGGDSDYVAFHADAGTTIYFDLRGQYYDSPLDAVMTLQDSTGAVLDSQDDTFGLDPWFYYDVPATGWYRIVITRSPFTGSGAGYFWVLHTWLYTPFIGGSSLRAAPERPTAPRASAAAKLRAATKLRTLRDRFPHAEARR